MLVKQTCTTKPQEGSVTKKLAMVSLAVIGIFCEGGLEALVGISAPGAGPGIALAQTTSGGESAYLEADARPVKTLSIREAIEQSVANNLDVAIRRKDPESARYGVTSAEAFFDPLLESSASYGRSRGEPLSDFAAQGDKSWRGSLSLSQILQEGFSYTAAWATTKNRAIYPSAATSLGFFSVVTPTYSSGLTLSFRQPLLRGFGFRANRTEIEIAQIGLETSQETFRRTVIDTLGQVENAYWDLSAAISNLEVTRQSLKLANDLLVQNRKKVEVGTLAPIQITEAEASVASREEGVIVAQADIRNAEDNLRRIMNVPPDSAEWGMAITPSDTAPFQPGAIDLQQTIREAMEKRPDLAQARQDVRTLELRYRFAQNARKPALDAFGTYAPSGNNYEADKTRTGFVTSRQFVDANQDGINDDVNGDGTFNANEDFVKVTVPVSSLRPLGLSESVSEVFAGNLYDWSVGLNLSIPIGNRNARAAEARSRIAFEQSQMTLENLERGVAVEVRAAVRAVETGAKRVTAARSSVVLQEKKLEAEQKRFDNGISTSFQVLTFQNDLTAARSSEIAAITAYNKALVELGRATATLPERRGVTIVAP